jgi:hypothetical protein
MFWKSAQVVEIRVERFICLVDIVPTNISDSKIAEVAFIASLI